MQIDYLPRPNICSFLMVTSLMNGLITANAISNILGAATEFKIPVHGRFQRSLVTQTGYSHCWWRRSFSRLRDSCHWTALPCRPSNQSLTLKNNQYQLMAIATRFLEISNLPGFQDTWRIPKFSRSKMTTCWQIFISSCGKIQQSSTHGKWHQRVTMRSTERSNLTRSDWAFISFKLRSMRWTEYLTKSDFFADCISPCNP